MISDVDPADAFWYAERTGEEMVLHLVLPPVDDQNLNPSAILEEWGGLTPGAEIVELEIDDRKIAYGIAKGEVGGVVAKDQFKFWVGLGGSFPVEKEAVYREGIETVFNTLDLVETKDVDFSNGGYRLWGVRLEGHLLTGTMFVGYVPVYSLSQWDYVGAAGQEISIKIDTQDHELSQENEVMDAKLIIDVLDGDGNSLLTSGPTSFTNRTEIKDLRLPTNATYTIQIYAPVSEDSPWYGWYQITLE